MGTRALGESVAGPQEGTQAAIRLFDTLSGGLKPLVPRQPGLVRMYTCGPTVYNFTHIGHLRPALVGDVLARHLERRGYRVLWVSNFTDIDDRIIARAAEQGIPATAFADRYIADYLHNLALLGIDRIERFARVTEHIPDILEMVSTLVERGLAYAVEGDVYFSVMAKRDYGKLSGRSLDDMQAGARVAVDPRKRHPMDFALWKAAKPQEPHWESPWGPGRPGWHIECSAMSLRYLGDGFDIHGGGGDLIFPHHENEIAQSEAFTGNEPFVHIWLHNAMVEVGGEKISKSQGNFVPLRDLVRQYSAGVLRQFVLSTHYRKPLQYTAAALEETRRAWNRLASARQSWEAALGGVVPPGDSAPVSIEIVDVGPAEPAVPPVTLTPPTDGADLEQVAAAAERAFLAALDDDLNTAGALGVLFDLVRHGNAALATAANGALPRGLAAGLVVLRRCGDVLGLWEGGGVRATVAAPGEEQARAAALVDLLLQVRADARTYRDFAMADRIRAGLAAAGVQVEDTPQGTRWAWGGALDASAVAKV